jgi:hypothetical protein
MVIAQSTATARIGGFARDFRGPSDTRGVASIRRPLGQSALRVSSRSAATFSGGRRMAAPPTTSLDTYFDHGGSFIDTADSPYAAGSQWM